MRGRNQKVPGDIYAFECEAFFGQNRNPWRFSPVGMRGVFQSEPKSPAIFSSLNARRYSVRTKIPGDVSQRYCEVCFGQNQNSRRYSPVYMRGVCRSEPKFLAVCTTLNARCLSVRTRNLGDISQSKCGVRVGQNQNHRQFCPV